ncbi:MAG: LPS-assembly protein LptD [Nitrospirae bacterium]|nr:LPS-assembly protein LptD [Nitrospirota bacterium]
MPRSPLAFLTAVLAVIALASASAFAETPGLNLTADRLDYDTATNEFTASGHARLEDRDTTLEAGTIRYNRLTGSVAAEGQAHYRDNSVVIEANTLSVHLETGDGAAKGNVSMYYIDGNARVTGQALEKKGANHFILEDGMVTTCDGDSPAWSLRTARTDLRLGTGISCEHVRFRVRALPVFYIPYFWAPVLLEKQSGFLFPEFGHSNTLGSIFKLRYYWMIGVNRDATIEADYFSRRGFGKGLEYRYLESPGTGGEFRLYHIRDDEDGRQSIRANLHHDQSVSDRTKAFIDINAVSGGKFNRDFAPGRDERIQRFNESIVHIGRQGNALHLFATGRAIQNMDGSSGSAPQSALAGLNIFRPVFYNSAVPAYFRFDASAGHFEREVDAAGTRFHAAPTLFGAFRLPFATFNPLIAYEKSWYDLRDFEDAGPEFGAMTLQGVLSTRLSRDFGGISHTVEPGITHRYVKTDGDSVPSFTMSDTLTDENVTTLSLINSFSGESGEMIRITLSDGYDHLNENRPWTDAAATIILRGPLTLTSTAAYNVYDNHFASAKSDMSYNGDSARFSVGHSYERDKADTFTMEAAYKPVRTLELSTELWYDLSGAGLRELDARAAWFGPCWGMSVTYTQRPDEQKLMAGVTLKGLGE